MIIRAMNLPEVRQIAIKWAADEGWNPGLKDAEAFFEADPEGFLLATIDNKPVACISAVSYGETFGFVGFYVVIPKDRGKGYGWRIWQKAMECLEGKTIGLDGVMAQQENYKKSGFRLAYRNIRYEWANFKVSTLSAAKIVSVSNAEFDKIIQYDSLLFPAARTNFLFNWLNQCGAMALVSLDNDRNVQGYGVIRPCLSGWKIGPLFADNMEIAETLLLSLAAKVPDDNGPVYFDIPEVNEDAVKLARKYCMQPMFETARMYKGCFPEINLNKIFGVTTFELG